MTAKRIISLLVVSAIVGTVVTPSSAQDVSKVGTTAADFLNIDVGPRAMAMGGAFVGAADDASAMYWNPAWTPDGERIAATRGAARELKTASDVFFGPRPPDGKEDNWLQTIPGKSWFAILRMYGPLQPWIDKTWRPGEIEGID